ncbi:MAG: glycosyltransferase family 1 protein [Acidobacteriota bacterium]
MRIGLDAGKALYPHDGIGRYSRELLAALADAVGDDEIVLFGLPQGHPESELLRRLGNPVGPCRLPTSPDEAIDIFHATAWTFPPQFRGPIVFTCYDLTFLTHSASHTLDNKIHCLTGLLEARLAEATFVAISQATKDEMVQQLGFEQDLIQVIYPAPSADLEPQNTDDARRLLRERFGVDGEPVLALATLEPRKNFARLLEAYLGLNDDLRFRHPLVIAGGGGWKNTDLLTGLDESSSVHLIGRVEEDELAMRYSAAALFAYPSLAEGFGLPVVEAMACGTPVLTAGASAMSEVAGGAARLVDPLDVGAIRQGLDELLRDPEERHRLSALGRRRAAEFSWRRTAQQTLEIYRQLLAA